MDRSLLKSGKLRVAISDPRSKVWLHYLWIGLALYDISRRDGGFMCVGVGGLEKLAGAWVEWERGHGGRAFLYQALEVIKEQGWWGLREGEIRVC
jgi:hypothetical protein